MWYSSFVLLFKIMYRRHVEYLMNLMVLMLICDFYRVPTMAQEVIMLNSRGLQSEGCSNRVLVRGGYSLDNSLSEVTTRGFIYDHG